MAKPKFPEGSVCKPCWELKYCPYGYLVEYFPLFHKSDTAESFDTQDRFDKVTTELATSGAKTWDEVHDYFRLLSILDPESNSFISQYDPEDVACRIFGHSCPVFFMQSGATETKEPRSEGRHIPRAVMLKVVRRDNYVCQSCRKHVEDDEIEFDHVIPYSKGGPTTVENLKLLCRDCNRRKSDSLSGVL